MPINLAYISQLLKQGRFLQDNQSFEARPLVAKLSDYPNIKLGNELAFVYRFDVAGNLKTLNANFGTIYSATDIWDLTGKFKTETISKLDFKTTFAQLTARNSIIMTTDIIVDIKSQKVFSEIYSAQLYMYLIKIKK